VRFALAAGLSPRVYGGGWRGLVDDEFIAGEYVANSDLAALYRSSGVVINDHWDDMRVDGFVSNRVFDVLASGGRLLTDRAEGIEALFGEDVQFFTSQHDLAETLEGDWRARFPTESRRVSLAHAVRDQHSFDARSRVLIDRATRLMKQRDSSS
jgi:O-antigen biosynthesis protein